MSLFAVLVTSAAVAANIITAPTILTAYFPVLPFEAPPDAEPEFMPVLSNQPLAGPHESITRAILVVHDGTRDAAHTLADMTRLAGGPDAKGTLVLSPQFYTEADLTKISDQLPDNGQNFARWPLGGWGQGGDSISLPGKKGISSFTPIDLLLMFLSDKNSFPALKQVVIAGHGDGGDFVQRYAGAGRAQDFIDPQNLNTQYVVANPSSYLYFTGVRFKGGKQGFGTPDNQCGGYNTWPYGLDDLSPYARRVGANAIKLRYASRQITYLIGAKVAKADPMPDSSCSATLQGADRVSRANNFQMYMDIVFGEDAHKTQQFSIVPNMGYDAAGLFSSKCGTAALLDTGKCMPTPLP